MSEPHAVAALIQRVKDQDARWNENAALARRAQAHGHRLTKQQIGDIVNKPIATIDAKRIHALAAALDVTPETVALAYLEAFGVRLSGVRQPGVEAAIRGDSRLSSDDKENLLALLGAMRKRRAE